MLQRGVVVRAATLDDLPAEAAADKERFKDLGVRSVLTIPLSFEGSFRYSLSINSRVEERDWPEDYLPRLKLLGKILISAIERGRVRARLEEQLLFEALLADLSARFIGLPSDRIDGELQKAQRLVCELLGFDRCALWQVTEGEPEALSLTHLHPPSGAPPPPGQPDVRILFPWVAQKVLSGETLAISRMADLPQEAAVDREAYRSYGTTSAVVMPLSGEQGSIIGGVSFGLTQEERAWPETTVNYLRLVAHVFANALTRKRAEQALRWSEQRFRDLFETSKDSILLVDQETGAIIGANPAACRLYGYTPEEFITLRNTDVSAEPEKTESAVLQSVQDVPLRLHRKKDGTVFPVEISGGYFAEGNLRLHTAFIRDITERKRMEDALRESETKLRAIFDNSRDAIVVAKDKIHVLVNPAYVSLFGYESADEIIGTPLIDLIAPESRGLVIERIRKHAADEPVPPVYELTALKKDGTRFLMEATVSYYTVKGDQYILPIVRDITERRRAEQEALAARRELLRTDRLLHMGELTASIAHELNQPLTSILSNARAAIRLIESGKIGMGELVEILQDIADDDKRAGLIIRSLRAIVKPEDSEREQIELNDVVREVVALFNSEAIIQRIRIETELADSLPPVSGDKVQLQQVLINLMMNAADSMEGSATNRRIVIRTGMPANGGVMVDVRDFGTGIDENEITRIFDPFFSTKGSGLGMGLSLCRSIIESHGGHIWAENSSGGGATFYFTLPAAGARGEVLGVQQVTESEVLTDD
jgi:PAS domain S-box-containing protein